MQLDRKTLRKILFEEVEAVAIEAEAGKALEITPAEPLAAFGPGIPSEVVESAEALISFVYPNGGPKMLKTELIEKYPADVGNLTSEQLLIVVRELLGAVEIA